MTAYDYDRTRTGILLVDPLNDFLADEGKLWPLISEVAEEVDLRANLSDLVSTARETGVPVFYVPHHRYEPGSYESWAYPNPSQRAAAKLQLFAQDAFGGDWYTPLRPEPSDVVVSQHWAQSGFANTDLEMRLRQHGVDHVIVVGLLANTCIESTARFAMELGFHVSLVTDATAAYTPELMRAAHELNGPTFAHVITDTKSVVAALHA
ncbi:isochorismatase family cysteine hydrolase [Streptomyces sp. NPDC001833]|uniref:isochorismatase family cysteine hydrolase n=1 Tax=Streptomyces sp. NPDC001833 TaxID=3154658 RepID=UPI00331A0075